MSIPEVQLEEYEVFDLLESLVEKNLVLYEETERGPEFRCLESVRQYGGEQAALAGEVEAAHERHLEWFLRLAEQAEPALFGPEQAQWCDLLDEEHANLSTALQWCHEAVANPDPGLRMAAALQRYWSLRGTVTEGRRELEAALGKAENSPPSAALARVLQAAGNMVYTLSDFPAARSYFEQSLEVRRRIGDRAGEAGSLGSLGNVAHFTGDYAAAHAFFEESLAINRAVGNRVWEAMNLACLGNLMHDMGDPAAAIAYLEEALILNRAVGNRATEVISLAGIGSSLSRQGDYAGAIRRYQEGLAISKEIGDSLNITVSQLNIGDTARKSGDPESAFAWFRLALHTAAGMERDAHLHIHAHLLEVVAALWLASGEPHVFPIAARLLAAAVAGRREIGAARDPDLQALFEEAVAQARHSLGEVAFEAAWEDGGALSIRDGIELALRTGEHSA